ncbi:hypothetical protein ACQ5SO_09630 [Rhodovulum sp. DZ06]|uniref:hypothetical protein n=1 Tax=Rhodovulum sp. DZ06 TaxID=3425126 RepID=UPI003D33B859
MIDIRATRFVIGKWLKVLTFLTACFVVLTLGAFGCIATVAGYYDSIHVGETLSEAVEDMPHVTARDIGVTAGVAAMPRNWLPERTGTVGGIRAHRGVELYLFHPAFNITVLLDDRDRVLIKHPSYE